LNEHPEIEEIVVFGSFANDTYAPGSDLDLFIILKDSNRSVRDRIPDYLPNRFPVPVDVFPFTRKEMEVLSSSPLIAAVRASTWRYSR
jgi:predicted nucleotidyltransferase